VEEFTPLLITKQDSPLSEVPNPGVCQPYTLDFPSFALLAVLSSWNYRPGLRVQNQLQEKNHKTSFTWL